MSESAEPTEPSINPSTAKGLSYARWAGRILGAVLIIWGLASVTSDSGQVFNTIKGVYFLALGIVVNLPFQRLPKSLWKWSYISLCALSAGFVFVMVVSVMFAYMELAERGEKLGVPGLEGTLVFLALLQPPVVLFQRKPDLLD